MKESIFTVQPGLASRCMWHFECDEYSGEELGQIFLKQVSDKKILFDKDDTEQIIELISKNKDFFPGSGRDTARLLNFVESIISSNNFGTDQTDLMTISDIEQGLEVLKENNISSRKNNDENLMDMYSILSELSNFKQ